MRHLDDTVCSPCLIWGHVLISLKNVLLFTCSVMSDSLWPHGLQQARPPCPSPFPRACSNSCPLSRWCHPTISSSVVPFFSRLQSFPASGSFLMSQFFVSGGQSIGASVSPSVLSVNIQVWYSLGLTGFSSGHVWMSELDCEKGWAPKNWCWRIDVVLEKTLESLLDCKEIQPVHPKGN